MMFDVAVVGAGPSGSIAAKISANNKLKTVLIEKKTLPRDKPCGGLLTSSSLQIIRENFGKIPEKILESQIEDVILLPDCKFHERVSAVSIYRKPFDYWLTQKAEEAGAVIHIATLKSLSQERDCIIMKLKSNDLMQEISAKYVIGADGAGSTVRSCLYPNQKRQLAEAYQAYAKGQLSKKAVYVYFPLEETRVTFFWLIPKKRNVVFGVGGLPPIDLKKLMQDFHSMIKERYKLGKIWRYEAHPIPIFSPADYRIGEGRILLVGDAASLANPFTGEGIFSSLVSGKAAIEAIIEDFNESSHATKTYKKKLKTLISKLKGLYELSMYYQSLDYEGRQSILESYFGNVHKM